MQLIKNAVFLALTSMAVAAAGPASAAYVVTLTNGETISAQDYKIHDRKIELKLEGGSASFPRSLVASISGGGTGAKPLPPSSDARAAALSPVRTPVTRPQNSGEDTLRKLAVENGDPEAGPKEEGVKQPDENDMTVEEFLDKEGDDVEEGDDSVDAADQDSNSGDDGFMPEEADQGDKVTEQ